MSPTALPANTSTLLRPIAAVAFISLAYHYSLTTLVRGLGLQTPLAYLALVPLIAIALAWVAVRRAPEPRPIHDRQLDYIVGLGLIAVASSIGVLMPDVLATRFWLYRLDLVTLPIFAAGIVTILFGLRMLWTVRFPIAFLFLAWPAPYLPLVGDGMRAFVDATSAALIALSSAMPFVEAVPGDEAIFFIHHGQEVFPLSVSSACSGVNGLVGFILIGGALAYVVDGRLERRLLWLATGLVTIWLLNVVRIVAIFLVAGLFGQYAAIEVLHPVAGLILFNVGVLAMIVAVPLFGLHFVPFVTRAPAPLRFDAPPRRLRPALIITVAVVLILAGVNRGYARYEPLAGDLGEARLVAFDARAVVVPHWEHALVARYTEGREFFGPSSTWERVLFASTPTADLRSSAPIYVDAIDTPDANALAVYGIAECYRFHGFTIESVGSVDVGSGVKAQVVDYANPRDTVDWTALWWEWPVRADGQVIYQRVVIFVANGPGATYDGVPSDLPGGDAPRFAATNRFLTALARARVAAHVERSRS